MVSVPTPDAGAVYVPSGPIEPPTPPAATDQVTGGGIGSVTWNWSKAVAVYFLEAPSGSGAADGVTVSAR